MTADRDPLRRYLDQLRASLRSRDADLILAEAEDHLREGTAAGLAAGLTEAEAQEAAISAFGSVHAVVRAHRTPRDRAAAAMADIGMAAWKLAGLYLLVLSATGLALDMALRMLNAGVRIRPPALGPNQVPVVPACAAAAVAGLILLGGYWRVRRSQRRRGPAGRRLLGGYFPVAAAVAAMILSLALGILGIGRVVPGAGFGAFVTAMMFGIGCAVVMGRTLVLQRRPA